MDDKPNQKSGGVGDDVTLAAFNPFPGVITRNPSTFSGFHALAVPCLAVDCIAINEKGSHRLLGWRRDPPEYGPARPEPD